MLATLFSRTSSGKSLRTIQHNSSYSKFIEVRNMASAAGDIDTATKSGQNLLSILENSPKRWQRIKFLGKLFESGNYELRIAGGAVRDILRGVEPKDIDFATTALPDQSLELLQRHEDIMRIIVTAAGKKHGTVAVKFKEAEIDFKKIKLMHDPQQETKTEPTNKSVDKPEYDEESPYEITTLRCDCFTDGRHAEVKFINDWRIDAERRDLTINAMFLTLDEGKLVDYFNGESDLKNGIVKFVGDADLRLKEDYLRILRFYRFWSRYGRHNQPSAETLSVIENNLDGLDGISGERMWVEIKKIFGTLPCYEVIILMLKSKIFQHIGIKETANINLDAVQDEVKFVQSNVEKYLSDTSRGAQESKSIALDKKLNELIPIILFATVVRTEEDCLSACFRIKFSNLERDSILYIIENRLAPPKLDALKYQLAMAHGPERPHILLKMKAFLIYKGSFETLHILESWNIPNFPLSGHIISQEMRKQKLPGNKIKFILEALKSDWASSDYEMTSQELEQRMLVKLQELKQTKR